MARETTIIEQPGLQDFEQRMSAEKPANLVPADQITTTMQQAQDIFGVVSAQKVQVARDEPMILRKIAARAAAAGEDWFYRYQVKKKGGGIDWIEGPSIQCTDNVAQLFGNCSVAVRIFDEGSSFMCYARFADIESGYSLERAVPVSKSAIRLGGDDQDRRVRMACSLGQSFAIRNVVHHAIPFFVDYAFEQAKQNLVDRVGKRLPEYRDRCRARLEELNVPLKRVESFVGRVIDNWLAADVARVIAEIKAVADGMAVASDIWPAEAPAEPTRSDKPKPAEAKGESHTGSSAEGKAEPTTDRWALDPAVVGQGPKLAAILELLATTKDGAEVDALEAAHREFIDKLGSMRKAATLKLFTDRRATLEAAP